MKRGPDKGFWRIDEVRSPVIFWERCVVNEEQRALSGQLWAELDVTRRPAARTPRPTCSALASSSSSLDEEDVPQEPPQGLLVGPETARVVKEGALKLRENKHWGREIAVH